jgi:hypothetical protein
VPAIIEDLLSDDEDEAAVAQVVRDALALACCGESLSRPSSSRMPLPMVTRTQKSFCWYSSTRRIRNDCG